MKIIRSKDKTKLCVFILPVFRAASDYSDLWHTSMLILQFNWSLINCEKLIITPFKLVTKLLAQNLHGMRAVH